MKIENIHVDPNVIGDQQNLIEKPILPASEDPSKEMWQAMEAYHNMGLSMMWGRIDADPVKNKKPKSPIVTSWSSEPEKRFTLDELAKVMTKQLPHLRIAPIIICGKGSGNLIVIDLDIKHWPGIDVLYFAAVRETYPHLWPLIRRHKTMNGGYHLLYRTIVAIEFEKKNAKLAYKKDCKEAGIECRTHGGYVMAPPGAGYTVEHDVEIPTISVEDHERLFQLARLLNEEIPVVKTYTSKAYESVYDESPGQHFNSSPAAETVLQDNGWTFDYENSQWAHYTRPGKDGGVSASWHKTKRFYHIFTSSTDLVGTNFSPAALRCHFQFQDDWKKFYPVLVKEGYGKHKAGYEEKVIRKAVETGKPLPPNFSPEAQAHLAIAKETKNEKYPHGIFWEYHPTTDSYSVHRQLLEDFMYNLGLRLHNGEPCIIEAPFIRKLKEDKRTNGNRQVFRIIKSWIREEDKVVCLKICHEFIKYWQLAGEFTVSTLEILDITLIIRSKPCISYKGFKNGMLVITPDKMEVLPFDTLGGKLCWADEISGREFKYIGPEDQKKSMYVDYSSKAIKNHPDYVKLVVGYLCCGYKTGSESFLIALLESSETEKGGGSGKGFFAKILRFWRSILVIHAQAVKKDVDQLLQSWNGEDLVLLDELPMGATLSVLKNLVSDDSTLKKVYENLKNVPVEDMPKFLVSTQHGLDTKSDGGVYGRVRILAFGEYFDRINRTIRKEYGGDCPEIWDNEERIKKNEGAYDWDGFLSYIADAVQDYLGAREIPMVDDEGVWLKSFDTMNSEGESYLRDAIKEIIEYWSRLQYVPVGQVWEWFEGIKKPKYAISPHGRITWEKQLHEALKEYGEKTGLYTYEHMGDKKQTVEGRQQRVVKIKMLKQDDR